jgi:tRNA 2-thiouridine synthesizing protein A
MEIRHWDAGESGCGALIAGLKRQIEQVASGQLLGVTAHSVGAPVDLPAWCRLTGHELIKSNHPNYLLRRKQD